MRHVLLLAAVLCGAPAPANENAATAVAREVSREVNGALDDFERVAFAARRPDVEYDSQVVAWRDASGVRKVEATDLDDSGSVVTEYYYRDAGLVFAYVAIKGWSGAREVTRNERRQYFHDGALVRWLDGMDKVARAPDDPEYAREAALRLDAANFFRESATRAFQAPSPPR